MFIGKVALFTQIPMVYKKISNVVMHSANRHAWTRYEDAQILQTFSPLAVTSTTDPVLGGEASSHPTPAVRLPLPIVGPVITRERQWPLGSLTLESTFKTGTFLTPAVISSIVPSYVGLSETSIGPLLVVPFKFRIGKGSVTGKLGKLRERAPPPVVALTLRTEPGE